MENSKLLDSSITNILIADDSATDRKHLSLLLEGLGFNVTSVNSGNEAVTVAESIKPDVIFLDIIMEDGDGYHACRALKRNEVTADIPVVIASSKSNPVDKMWAERLGASAYIIKPFSDDDLLQVFQSI
jgi:twitching motility two-component system response regulator PilH